MAVGAKNTKEKPRKQEINDKQNFYIILLYQVYPVYPV